MKQVTKGTWNGYDTYILHSHDLQITLLPKLGNNVISIWDKHEKRHIVRPPSEQDLDFYIQKPNHFGMSLLLGKIRNGLFQYDGVDYQINRNTANKSQVHELHKFQSWCVSDIEEDEEGCTLTTEFSSKNDIHWSNQSPIPLRLQMTYTLEGSCFTQHLKVTNQCDSSTSFGLGFHSWFLLDGQPEHWTLKVPVESIYELDQELIPTGELAPLSTLNDLNSGMNLGGVTLDAIFRIGAHQPVEAVLTHNNGYRVKYVADKQYFKHWALTTKGTADEFLCIEPCTWLPNAPNLQQESNFTGLIDIQPHDIFETELHLEIIHRNKI